MNNNRPDYVKWYGYAIWRKLRKRQLLKQPLCQISLSMGLTVAADIVDHIKPHKGNWELFIDPDNLQSLSKEMHDTICQQMESGNYKPDIGIDGYPITNDYLDMLWKAKSNGL